MILQILSGAAGILLVVGVACVSTLLGEDSRKRSKIHKPLPEFRKN